MSHLQRKTKRLVVRPLQNKDFVAWKASHLKMEKSKNYWDYGPKPPHELKGHVEHAKHNMVLFGEADTYYASHIVYKKPHNFQVILKIAFDPNAKTKIANEMISHPKDQFIFLLDHMDISKINEKPGISGQIFRTNTDESKQIIFEQLALKETEYSIIYFDELPLSLGDTKNELSEMNVNSEKK